MMNPVVTSLAVQQAMVLGAMAATKTMASMGAHLLEEQARFLVATCGHRRCDDLGWHHMLIRMTGADLLDHYGHRAHDVNVERI